LVEIGVLLYSCFRHRKNRSSEESRLLFAG
jgi:hypothetical protein